ncbi:hypothetical protein EIJ81_00255 (plasmid) [Aliivibrio salmonicida]|uniref:hypothetical protein n=1 Tax=Aliivibrio salmonicida TaxID=40269 RepID=UPI000F6D96BA|nr:hypothetical protein [Aliivibrio salmonicida]AZL83334.1 hypothetical protein EIJ81_00255 [Aliivibrio salmonicida]
MNLDLPSFLLIIPLLMMLIFVHLIWESCLTTASFCFLVLLAHASIDRVKITQFNSELNFFSSIFNVTNPVSLLSPQSFKELSPIITKTNGYQCRVGATSETETYPSSDNSVIFGILNDKLTCCIGMERLVPYKELDGDLILRCGTWPLARIVTFPNLSLDSLTLISDDD